MVIVLHSPGNRGILAANQALSVRLMHYMGQHHTWPANAQYTPHKGDAEALLIVSLGEQEKTRSTANLNLLLQLHLRGGGNVQLLPQRRYLRLQSPL